MGAHSQHQHLQPPLAGQQRKQPVRKRVGEPVPARLRRHDQKQHQELAVDARLAQVAAHPAVEAQVDEWRERPDLLLLDKTAQHARSQTQSGVEGQRKIFVVVDRGHGQHHAAQHGPARPQQQAQQDDRGKGDVGSQKVGHPEPHSTHPA